MIHIFFDTEFTDLIVDPQLISIGLIDESGERTFYAELRDTWRPEDIGDFTREAVLPQLEGGEVRLTMAELSVRLGSWFQDFGEPVKLATDSLSWDWSWIQEIFYYANTWPANLDGKPLVLAQETEFNLAIERAFAAGLRRHHDLDDAKANRLGWIAAGGDIESTEL